MVFEFIKAGIRSRVNNAVVVGHRENEPSSIYVAINHTHGRDFEHYEFLEQLRLQRGHQERVDVGLHPHSEVEPSRKGLCTRANSDKAAGALSVGDNIQELTDLLYVKEVEHVVRSVQHQEEDESLPDQADCFVLLRIHLVKYFL